MNTQTQSPKAEYLRAACAAALTTEVKAERQGWENDPPETRRASRRRKAAPKLDKFEKALELHQSGMVFKSSTPDKFSVQSQSNPRLTYSVGVKHGVVYCACADFERTHKPCKHALASIGLPALIAITQVKWCSDAEELAVVVELHADALKQQPESLRAIARDELAIARQQIALKG